jgi:transposase
MKNVTESRKTEQILSEFSSRIRELEELTAKQSALIKWYESQLLHLKRRQFGASSERVLPEQLTLLGQVEIIPPPPEIEEVVITRKKRSGKREEDLANLPVIRVDHELPEDERNCPKCAAPMRDIGVKIRREIEIIPAQAVLKEHAIHSYACIDFDCKEKSDKTTIVTADAPKPLIAGSLASSSLVAHIAYQKYSNGMPLYRIEKGFQLDGVNVSRQNMCNWVINCSQMYLLSVYERMKARFLEETYAHADETVVQVLKEKGKSAQSKSYEWVYRTGIGAKHKIILYEYKPSRKQEHPQAFLAEFKGFLHTDGYDVYHNLPPDIVVVGCWAHARRYWEKIWKALPEDKLKDSDADTGLAYINALFKLERKFVNLPPSERHEKRLLESKPISDAFFAWVDSLRALPKSPEGEACTYAKNQRKYLENVFLDGNLELSNNRCERSVKPFVMGRKAWLFSDTTDGAEASSFMYSIIETAKENGLRPFNYLKFLLETLPTMSSGDDFDALLPWSESLPASCRSSVK